MERMAVSEGCGSAAVQRDGPLVSVTVSSLSGRCCEVQLSAKDTVETLRTHVASAWDMLEQQLEMIADVTVPDLDDRALDHGTQWTARVLYQSVRSMLDGFLTAQLDTGASSEYCDGGWPEATGPLIQESLGCVEPDDALHLPPNTPGNALGLLNPDSHRRRPPGSAAAMAALAVMPGRTSKGRRRRQGGPQSHRALPRAEAAAPVGTGAAEGFQGYSFGGPAGGALGLSATIAAGRAWGLPVAGVSGNVGLSAGTEGLPVAGFVGVGAAGVMGAAVNTHGPPRVGGAAWGLPVAGAVTGPVPARDVYGRQLISNSIF
mmetsp:Transcript_96726/g.167894  ORF Transcript_96726/g.167894 Transcript_96726/m.167894 type:complete len:318 (+) Transcript_96726:99-1052(+)